MWSMPLGAYCTCVLWVKAVEERYGKPEASQIVADTRYTTVNVFRAFVLQGCTVGMWSTCDDDDDDDDDDERMNINVA